MSAIVDRILEKLGDKELVNKLLSLPKSDLNSLLLDIHKKQSDNITPANVLKSYEANRFSVPSEINPVEYHRFQVEILDIAQGIGINSILLSPAAPFASCSAFGCVDQNNVVSATRGAEILADPTNMLAIIIADGLKRKKINNQPPIHYCTTARVLRAQPFPKVKGYSSHFGLFCVVSSGKDGGSYSCERELLLKHLQCYRKLVVEKYSAEFSVILGKRRGYTDGDGFFECMAELIKSELPNVRISYDFDSEDNNYYKGISFKLCMTRGGQTVEIGDGGFTDWVTQMTGNSKERCLTSAIGVDRLLM